jgi:tetratricopeptide (TPR) repeat protein
MQGSVKIAPELGIAHLYLSKCYLHQSSPKLALESYSKALERNPNLKDTGYWIDIQDGLSKQLIEMKQFDKAVSLYERVLQKLEREQVDRPFSERHKTRVLVSMAEIYQKKGDLTSSIKYYEKALELSKAKARRFILVGSATKSIHRSLADIFKEKGDTEKARYHENEVARLERMERTFTDILSGGAMTLFIGFGQFLTVLMVTIALGIWMIILKWQKKLQEAPPKKVGWGFGEIAISYLKAFLIPLGIFMSFCLSICIFNPVSINLFAMEMFFIPCVFAILSLVIYLFGALKKFKKLFKESFPGIQWTGLERSRAIFILTLWQLLCVGMIHVICIPMAYSTIMGILLMTG